MAEKSSGVFGDYKISGVNSVITIPAQTCLIRVAIHSGCLLAKLTFLHLLFYIKTGEYRGYIEVKNRGIETRGKSASCKLVKGLFVWLLIRSTKAT